MASLETSKIYSIPLPTAPNCSYSVSLGEHTFNFEWRYMNKMNLYIKLGDKVIFNGHVLKFGVVLNQNTKHLFNGGEFWFYSEGKGGREPTWEAIKAGSFYYESF